jgi:hypothetical protein
MVRWWKFLWNDPVWSKVIATGIATILGGIATGVLQVVSPGTLLMVYGVPIWLIAIAVILLAVLGYVALRRRRVPTVGLNFRNSAMDPYATGRTYPRKLNVYLSNDGDDIRLGEAKWIKDQIELQADKPPRIMYLLRNHPGGPWQSESTDKFVPSGMWVKMWVGLDSSVPDGDLKKLTNERRLGTVEIPAEISGAAIKLRIPL